MRIYRITQVKGSEWDKTQKKLFPDRYIAEDVAIAKYRNTILAFLVEACFVLCGNDESAKEIFEIIKKSGPTRFTYSCKENLLTVDLDANSVRLTDAYGMYAEIRLEPIQVEM